MHLFHQPELASELIELSEEEGHHASSVLRLSVGDRIGLLDGKGTTAEATLEEVSKKRVIARIDQRTQHPRERQARIHIAVAPTKQMDRIEWFVEKAVELGVDRITPIRTQRTERNKLRVDRLHRVAISAMKQSQRAWLPRIDELTTLDALLKGTLSTQRYFGWCEGDHRSLMNVYDPTSDAIIMIGPEGDFTPEEAALLRTFNLTAVAIGTSRLRTETAALAACTWMSLAQQR